MLHSRGIYHYDRLCTKKTWTGTPFPVPVLSHSTHASIDIDRTVTWVCWVSTGMICSTYTFIVITWSCCHLPPHSILNFNEWPKFPSNMFLLRSLERYDINLEFGHAQNGFIISSKLFRMWGVTIKWYMQQEITTTRRCLCHVAYDKICTHSTASEGRGGNCFSLGIRIVLSMHNIHRWPTTYNCVVVVA